MSNPGGAARAQARAAGRVTFSAEVVEYWPACVECGAVIRCTIDIGRPGLWRGCACPDVAWRSGLHGWERHQI